MDIAGDLFILRHGETRWNAEGRLQGHLDSPLTDRGVAQARAQRAILAPVLPGGSVARVSPSPRAMQTAEIALAGLDVPAAKDARLLEVDLGTWQGHTLDEIAAANPHVAENQDPHLWKFTAPGGESLEHMTARCRAVLEDITGPTVLVTHGVTSRLLRCLALGMSPTGLAALPGGQGVVHRLSAGVAQILP
ncbi:MAG: histidine phosphatase family protein [Rhodobacteraceae bacterium]|nr:histidine phosphatase family protein [Paracoccaceae bacterium]